MATRMQQRRGTASQWNNADPVLAAGEIGFEIDTVKFKIGDGINEWSLLDYFSATPDLTGYATETYVDNAINGVLDSAPAALDTLNELAAALGDDADFSTTITNSIAAKAPLDSPSFTGTVNFSNSTVQGIEIPQPIHPFVMLGA